MSGILSDVRLEGRFDGNPFGLSYFPSCLSVFFDHPPFGGSGLAQNSFGPA